MLVLTMSGSHQSAPPSYRCKQPLGVILSLPEEKSDALGGDTTSPRTIAAKSTPTTSGNPGRFTLQFTPPYGPTHVSPQGRSLQNACTSPLVHTPLSPSEAQSKFIRRPHVVGGALLRANQVPSSIKPIDQDRLAELINGGDESRVLLVDVRNYAQFLEGHIKSAVSLCIPSTLLKRTTFGYDRIFDFVAQSDQSRFRDLQEYDLIAVYDANTSNIVSCGQNALFCTLLKFDTAPNHPQSLAYLEDGYDKFAAAHPNLIEHIPKIQNSASISFEDASASAPVLTSLSLPRQWSAAKPNHASVDDSCKLLLSDKMRTKLDEFPLWIQNIVMKSEAGQNVLGEGFMKLQMSEQARLQQAFFSTTPSFNTSSNDPSSQPAFVLCAGDDYSKNRYSNIYPYTHNRVVLNNAQPGASTYINASYIACSVSNLRYIATQAPLPSSFNDFWMTVYDHKVPIIVMLTALTSETGLQQSDNYWQPGFYGKIQIDECIETDLKGSNKLRKLTLRHLDHPTKIHHVTHLHYSDWPDRGCPHDLSDVIGLVEIKRKLMVDLRSELEDKQQEEPYVLVHCSAGCGRTGTFCTIDSVVDVLSRQTPKMRAQDNIDHISQVVSEFRTQRLAMVQTQRQYLLCYDSIIYWYYVTFIEPQPEVSTHLMPPDMLCPAPKA